MGDENKIRDTAEAIKGIVEAVPVYQDLLQPAAKEIGTGLQTVAKLVHVALSPVSAVIWGYEQIRDYLQETLTEKLKNVPPDQIVPPKLTIAGPTVEALRFAESEPSLRELYANLLATSMNSMTAEEAHPAFVEIIRQLNPDEARLIHYIFYSHPVHCFLINGLLYPDIELPEDEADRVRFYLSVSPYNTLAITSGCNYPNLIYSYLDNLSRLGLVRIQEEAYDTGTNGILFEMRDEEYIWDAFNRHIEEIGLKEKFEHVLHQGTMDILRFTDFGIQFCRACVDDIKLEEN